MENRIIAIIPFYNVRNFIGQCYNSLISQQYDNYKLYFLDDCSNDETLELVEEKKKIIKVRRKKRGYALKNIQELLTAEHLDDDDIILFVDGDDYLHHPRVFERINAIYNETKCLLTYGQYCTESGQEGHCSAYVKEEFERLRAFDWKASHLKTFRFSLYRSFLEQDPCLKAYKDENDLFYTMTYDVALMYPLMEIAGYENIYFNKEVLYVYRIHSFNDMSINREQQITFEKHIRSKRPFKRVF